MKKFKNNTEHYGSIAVYLHWLLALLIIGMLAVGLYMVNLPKGAQKMNLYDLHKATGMTVLVLVILRLSWRHYNIVPSLKTLPLWEKYAARFSHWSLYFLMLAMPLSGWMLTASAGYTVSYFGWFTVPNIITPPAHWKSYFGIMHEFFAYILIGFILFHIAGALKHHFIDKDNILKRMLRSY